jgi:hypothetical protein
MAVNAAIAGFAGLVAMKCINFFANLLMTGKAFFHSD